MILNKLLQLSYEEKLFEIFNNDKLVVSSIFNNFYHSFQKFNNFLKCLIYLHIIFILFFNLIFIIIFFYKLRINHFSKVIKFLKYFPFLKNINNFIISNLLLHFN